MRLCPKHELALETAIELRGMEPGIDESGFSPLAHARGLIVTHATHFAGRAAVEMLAQRHCALCFVNDAIRRDGRNPGLKVDDWVTLAADETLEEQTKREDGAPTTIVVTG